MPVTERSSYTLVALAEVRRATRTGIAKRVRALVDVTQGEIAGELGVDPATVSLWESGRRRPTGRVAVRYLETLIAWAATLDSDDEAVMELQRTSELLRELGAR